MRGNSRSRKATDSEVEGAIKNWLKNGPRRLRCGFAKISCNSGGTPSVKRTASLEQSSEDEDDAVSDHDQIGGLIKSIQKRKVHVDELFSL